ncbi:hypothetical protein DW695_15965 [Bacteroides fragilis]|nr:hypothetical protein DW695_15965 [Bacteroides fragilis]RHK12559.1 hypothetical protein DW078_21275 [Bacteroides fragilis]HCW09461.1 hypothetical protein [Bacteroides fragilis]
MFAQQYAHPSFPLRFVRSCLITFFIPLSHILCKFTFTSVISKNKKSKFAEIICPVGRCTSMFYHRIDL